MPRRSDTFIPSGYYHIYNRGANRNLIFFNEKDFLRCLGLIKQYARRYQISVIAYCLLSNHYHFLLRQDGDAPVSKFIGSIFNSYVQSLNKRLGSVDISLICHSDRAERRGISKNISRIRYVGVDSSLPSVVLNDIMRNVNTA